MRSIKLSEVFPTAVASDDIMQKKLTANTVRGLIEDPFLEEFHEQLLASAEALKKKLKDRHIGIGKLIGVGNIALVFELHNLEKDPATGEEKLGERIKSAAMRIEPGGAAAKLDNPGVVPIIQKIADAELEANIVPMAERNEAFTSQDVGVTLSALNAEGKLHRLKDMNNPIPDQFMRVPGIDIPVFVDLNAISQLTVSEQVEAANAGKAEDEKERIKGWGNLQTFIDTYAKGLSLEDVQKNKMPADKLEALYEQQHAVIGKVRGELGLAGITLDPVETRITAAHGTQLTGHKAERTVA